jgi:O-antigen/teichoic acid export membrane protein
MTLRNRTLSGFRWTATVKFASQIITWAITLLVVRLLTPTDYGLLAMATVFVAFLTMFSELGLGPAIVQRRDMDETLLRRVFGVVLLVHAGLAAILALSAPLIAAFYNEPRVAPIVQVLSIQFVLSAFIVIPDAQLLRRMEFRNRSLLDLSGAIIGSVATLALAFSGEGVWSLVTGSILSQTWKTIGLNVLSPFPHWPEFSLRGLKSMLAFGGHITAAGVFGMFFAQIDTVICAKLLGHEILGFYSVGVNLASLPSQKTAGLVNGVAFPAFSSVQHDVRKVREYVLMGVRVLSFFAFPVSWGMSSIAPEIVQVVLGPKWTMATIPLQALALVVPFRIVGNFIGVAVQGRGRPDIILRNTIWAASLGAPLLFGGAYFWGLTGLSVAWLVVSPLLFIPALMRSASVINVGISDVTRASVPAAGASLAMYAVVYFTRRIIGHADMLHMIILIAVGVITYGTVSLLANRERTAEVVTLLRSMAVAPRS